MDPLTAIGAVASICQLANAALSLSKTLYSLGSAIGSASEDVQILAEDLKTFSQSLTLLSRLLEDSKSWYSDDIYLLTAKIIKDCAELYAKIEKVLVKLDANGKSSWKSRVKFVYKESEIKKLLKRLRDMKGTLATILMTLQVDLQLSLLNLSTSSSLSSSKSRDLPGISLQSESLQTLKDAQQAVESGGFMTRYFIATKQVVELSKTEMRVSTTRHEEANRQPTASMGLHSRSMVSQPVLKSGAEAMSKSPDHTKKQPEMMDASIMPQNFTVIPSDAADMQDMFARKCVSTSIVNKENSRVEQGDVRDAEKPPQVNPPAIDNDTCSIESSSSVESFKSAKSTLQEDIDSARKIKAVQRVMHAFRSVLGVLENLIKRRIQDKRWDLYASATHLKACLVDGREHIDRRNIGHLKKYGEAYANLFERKDSNAIERFGSLLLQDVGIKLHEYTSELEELENHCFELLASSTTSLEREVIEHLDIVAVLASKIVQTSVRDGCASPAIYFNSKFQPHVPEPLPTPSRWQHTRILPEPQINNFAMPPASPGFSPTSPCNFPTSPQFHPTSPDFSPESPRDSPTSPSIPQMAYTATDFAAVKLNSSVTTPAADIYDPAAFPSRSRLESQDRRSLPPPPRETSRIGDDSKIKLEKHPTKLRKRRASGQIRRWVPPDNDTLINLASGQKNTPRTDQSCATSTVPSKDPSSFQNATDVPLCVPRLASPFFATPGETAVNDHGRQDYPTLLMSLKQQNKKRLMMAQQESENFMYSKISKSRAPGQPAINEHNAPQDYSMLLMQLEQQNKKRRMLAQQEMDMYLRSSNVPNSSNAPSSLVPIIDDQQHAEDSVLPIREPACSPGPSSETPQPPMAADHLQQDYRTLAHTRQRLREQQADERILMSRNEETVDEALDILLKLDPSRKFQHPVRISEADRQALQDYQMSLMNLTCGNPKRRMMYHADGENNGFQIPAQNGKLFDPGNVVNAESCGTKASPAFEPAERHGESFFQNGSASSGDHDHAMPDALQDFDFDSFLHEEEGTSAFNFSPVALAQNPAHPSSSASKEPAQLIEPSLTGSTVGLSVEYPDTEDKPLFINAKQFHRLLKRRTARQNLEEQMASRASKSFDTNFNKPLERSQGATLLRPDESTTAYRPSMKSDVPSLMTPPLLLSAHPNNAKDIELAWSHPMLTPAQTSRLWWQAYISYTAASSRKSSVFIVLSSALESELGFSASSYASDQDICHRVAGMSKQLSIAGSTLHDDRPELRDVLFLRGDIVRMLLTVNGRLGLETATLGWSCVSVFVNIFNRVLNLTSPLCPSSLGLLETSFSQLQEIVHIISRYAVMENLYQQSITSGTSTTLSIKPEYQSSLLSLCSSILEWFAASYDIGKIVVSFSDANFVGIGASTLPGDLDETLLKCEELMAVIREKNKGCQIFRVEVDVKYDGLSGEESGDTEVEDVSDASWEEICDIDIDAAVTA